MKPRIYIDTSVIGGCDDEQFAGPSLALMECFASRLYTPVISALTIQELMRAPARVRDRLTSIPEELIEGCTFGEEAKLLSEAYVSTGVLSRKSIADAQHIAIASVARVEVLVSWNFKHIVNLRRIQGFNSVNLRHGYPMLEIRSPIEVLPLE